MHHLDMETFYPIHIFHLGSYFADSYIEVNCFKILQKISCLVISSSTVARWNKENLIETDYLCYSRILLLNTFFTEYFQSGSISACLTLNTVTFKCELPITTSTISIVKSTFGAERRTSVVTENSWNHKV